MRNPQRDDREYVQDILDRIQRIETFVASGQNEFLQSVLIQDAVIRTFEVIGEATKRLSPDFRQRYPAIGLQVTEYLWRGSHSTQITFTSHQPN